MQLAKRKTPMVLPGGMGVAYSEDVAEGHVRAAAQAAVGERFMLAESFQSLTDIARAVAAAEPRAKVPRVMPLRGRPGRFDRGGGGGTGDRPPADDLPRACCSSSSGARGPRGRARGPSSGGSPTPFATGVEQYAGALPPAGLDLEAPTGIEPVYTALQAAA